MGMLISRFRKKKTTIEILEDLDKKIKEIEQYGQNTEQRHKRIVGTLILYSVALYTITAVIFYFYFFPASLYDQLFYITPLLLFPFLILFTKKMVTWYYKRKISRNQSKLVTMQEEKKQILDVVTDTETYKKAKEILLKFAPDQLRMSPQSPQVRQSTTLQKSTDVTPLKDIPRYPSTPVNTNASIRETDSLRRRILSAAVSPRSPEFNKISQSPSASAGNTPSMLSTPTGPGFRPYNSPLSPTTAPLPRPILPQQRSYIDRLIEYLVGDGPSNRYALICRHCDSHNGMSLKEEFEYFGFRCCYCNSWNPARKQKPSAPKLDLDNTIDQAIEAQLVKSPKPLQKENEIETISTNSESDSDIEVVEKPGENGDDERISAEEEDEDEGGKGNEGKSGKAESSEESPDKMEIDQSPMK